MTDVLAMSAKISVSTCLWFESRAEEAAKFYVSLFEDARITNQFVQGEKTLTVNIVLCGHEIMLLNGGPHFRLTEAASIIACCESEMDCDRLWAKLTADGGVESQCGWLKDMFGVSWQIVPAEFIRMAQDKDGSKVQRMMTAMMPMKKLDIRILRRAFEG